MKNKIQWKNISLVPGMKTLVPLCKLANMPCSVLLELDSAVCRDALYPGTWGISDPRAVAGSTFQGARITPSQFLRGIKRAVQGREADDGCWGVGQLCASRPQSTPPWGQHSFLLC